MVEFKGEDSLARELFRDVEKRLISNFLDFIVFSALNGNGGCISGYDLLKYVHKRYHFLISPGTAYSCLYAMERLGLLQGRQEGNKRVFSLTEKGLDMLKAVDRLNGSVQRLFAEIFRGSFVGNTQLP